MPAARNSSDFAVERSVHGPMFDSFSESVDSREGSRKGPALVGPKASASTVQSAFAHFRSLVSGPGGQTISNGGASWHHGRRMFPGGSASHRRRSGEAATRSLHSGEEFYRQQQQQAGDGSVQEKSQQLRGGSVSRGRRTSQPHVWRPEGSVSRHRGSQFYAEAATRWKAAVASGDPRRVAELVSAEARASRDDVASTESEGEDTSSVFFDFPETGGAGLPPRWNHAAAAVGERLYVYGGIGPDDRPQSDIHFFSVTTNMWRPVVPIVGSKKDGPPAMSGHAVAAAGSRIWVAGGRLGKKLQRKTFTFNTETLSWRVHKENPNAPAGVADLTLTYVGEHGVVSFGGIGSKSASAATHHLQPTNGGWSQLHATGTPPSARGRHSAVWDGEDRLIVFGGADAGDSFAPPAVHVLSLNRRRWEAPLVAGQGPGPRAGHCAAMLGHNGARTMAVFGGVSPTGELLNDVWLLDVVAWRWVRGVPLGASPTGRHGAACSMLAGARIALCGGMSSQGTLDSLLLLTADFGKELTPLAAELSLIRRSAPAPAVASEDSSATTADDSAAASSEQPTPRRSSASLSPGSSAAAARGSSSAKHQALPAMLPTMQRRTSRGDSNASSSGNASQRGEDGGIAAVQLTELLRRRNVSEAAAEAARRAELAEKLFQHERKRADALEAEVAQLRLVASEAEQAASDAAAALRDESRRSRRDQGLALAELSSAQTQIQDLTQRLAATQATVAQLERFREAAAAASVRERAASDAAIAARSQCASLARRCSDLASRLHAQRVTAAVAAAAQGTQRPTSPGAGQPAQRGLSASAFAIADPAPSASGEAALTGAATATSAQPLRLPPPPPLGCRLSIPRLPSIGEDAFEGQSSPPSSVRGCPRPGGHPSGHVHTDADDSLATAPADGSPLLNHCFASDEAAAADGAAASYPAAGDASLAADTLDSAFERWSMGGAASPSPNTSPADVQPLSLVDASCLGSPTAGLSGSSPRRHSGDFSLLQRSASEPLSPARSAREQRGAAGFPSRSGAAVAVFGGHLGLQEHSAAGAMDSGLSAALAAERERRARLEAMLTARQQAADERLAALEHQLACLAGQDAALSACTPSELEDLEKRLAAGATAVRRAALTAAAREAAAESSTCSLCMEHPQRVVFNCGHQVCAECSKERCPTDCPFCRTAITARINVFRS